MKVELLIEELKKVPPGIDVFVQDGDTRLSQPGISPLLKKKHLMSEMTRDLGEDVKEFVVIIPYTTFQVDQ